MNWETILQGIVIGESLLMGFWLIWIMVMYTIREIKK